MSPDPPDLACQARTFDHVLVHPEHPLHWSRVSIHLGRDGAELEGTLRLGALLQWLLPDSPAHIIARDSAGQDIPDPLEVKWSGFPLQEAIDAARQHAEWLGATP